MMGSVSQFVVSVAKWNVNSAWSKKILPFLLSTATVGLSNDTPRGCWKTVELQEAKPESPVAWERLMFCHCHYSVVYHKFWPITHGSHPVCWQYVLVNPLAVTVSKADFRPRKSSIPLSCAVLLSSQSLHTWSDLSQSFPHQKSPFWPDASFPLSLVRTFISARISTRHPTAFSSSWVIIKTRAPGNIAFWDWLTWGCAALWSDMRPHV